MCLSNANVECLKYEQIKKEREMQKYTRLHEFCAFLHEYEIDNTDLSPSISQVMKQKHLTTGDSA